MTEKTYRGSCHCGAVRFECRVDLDQSSKCNCSICGKGRFWKAIASADAFTLLRGRDALADYQFGSHAIHHRFCRTCGIKPFGRGHLEQLGGTFYAVNVACLDDVPDAELAAAKVRFENGRADKWESSPAETRHM